VFTGLIQAQGQVSQITRRSHGAELRIAASLGALELGESIAVDGVCLTVARFDATSFEVQASSETLARTTLGGLATRGSVHLERALRLSDRLGGHLVTGHVDGVGTVVRSEVRGDCREVVFEVPAALAPFIAEKGSIAVDGTSLTVNAVEARRFAVMLIPHTLGATHLGERMAGSRVNLEVDIVARYVARLLTAGGPPMGGLTLDQLARQGYV
jgi:riboflavin synthase